MSLLDWAYGPRYGLSHDPRAQQNITAEEQARRWALEKSMWARDEVHKNRDQTIKARKARAAEFRQTKPRKRYKDL